MVFRVFSSLVARDTVKLFAAPSLDVMRVGNTAAPNTDLSAAIAADGERNASNGLPWCMARGVGDRQHVEDGHRPQPRVPRGSRRRVGRGDQRRGRQH